MNEQLYCPLCLNPLDKHDECWPICNYTATNAKPDYQPLTYQQVINKKIHLLNTQIVNNKRHLAMLENSLELQKRLLVDYHRRLNENSKQKKL